MVAGPEQARLINEFEAFFDTGSEDLINHHETGLSYQQQFKDDVTKFVYAMTVMGNPFLKEGSELMTLDSHECYETVSHSMSIIRCLGLQKYVSFKDNVLTKHATSIQEPIRRNNLALFKRPGEKKINKQKSTLCRVKQDCNLFSHLYISSQVRATDMDIFFRHENNAYPPSLSDNGELRLPSKKSDLLDCLDTGRMPDPQDSLMPKWLMVEC